MTGNRAPAAAGGVEALAVTIFVLGLVILFFQGLQGSVQARLRRADITQRKEAEEALRKSELRHRDLTEMLPQTVYECDISGRITFMNQSGLDAFGLAREDLERGVSALDLMEPGERAHGAEGLRVRLAGDRGGPREYLMRRKDGSTFPGAAYSTAIMSEGRPMGVRGILIDITERKQREEAAREWAILVQCSHDAIIKEIGGRIAFWNAGAERMFGYQRQEILGRPLQAIIPQDCHGDVPQLTARLERGETVADFETQGLRKDGRRMYTSLSVTPLRDASGALLGSVGIMRDTSGIQEKQRDLLKRNSLLELLQASAVAANQAASAEEVIQTSLDLICSHTGWSVGHALVMHEGGQSGLRSTGLWHLEEAARFEHFRAASEGLVIEPGTGLAGRVLATGQPCWVADLALDAGVTRGKLATELGLKAAFASPILAGPEVAGVMEFFSTAPVEADDPFLQVIHSIGVQLGRVIERTRAGKALKESEARYRAITENASHGVLTLSLDGRILYANRTCEALLGYSCAELLGLYVSDLGPEWSRELVQRWLRGLTRRSDGNFSLPPFEAIGWHKSGQEKPLEVSMTGYLGKDDARVCTAVIRDISERKHAEDAVRKASQTLSAVVENSPLAIVTLDRAGTVKTWNAAAEQLFGWSCEEAVGLPLPAVPDAGDQQYRSGIERILAGETVVHEARRVCKDGNFVDVGAWGAPLRDGDGTITGLIIEYVDLTERKRLEAQLRQAQKLESIGQLAAGLAHEINTPIQYVGDNTHFLEEAFGELTKLLDAYDALLAEARVCPAGKRLVSTLDQLAEKADFAFLRREIPKAIGESLEGVGRVAQIVGAMKAFSHPGATELTPVDLNRAIESTILVCRNEWKYVADMATELDPSLPLIPCLPGEINQVILNLIINAAHAIADVLEAKPGKGTITVKTSWEEDWAEVRVRDTGTGIPIEVRSRIFDPFFTTKEVGKGTGQGLALAHSVVVQRHRGTIHFETQPGVGTTFIVRLPLRSEATL